MFNDLSNHLTFRSAYDHPAVLYRAAQYLYEAAVAHRVEEALKVEVNYVLPQKRVPQCYL